MSDDTAALGASQHAVHLMISRKAALKRQHRGGTWVAIPIGVRLKKMRWSFQAASQAALLDLRLRRLLIVSSVGTTLWMKVATKLLRPSPLVSTLPSLSASSTSPCTHGGRVAEENTTDNLPRYTPCHG